MSPVTPLRPEDLLGDLNDVERKNAPEALFYAGDPGRFFGTLRISVVGTRRPSALGVQRPRVLATTLSRRGVLVVSGLAEGVDTIAHETAMAEGGRTMAVIGNGVDVFFPASNRGLQARIMAEHFLVSQFPAGTPPKRTNFPQRNRTMALLSDATIIVEAGEGSGTLHQGWEALRLGRPLFLLESLANRADITWPAEMMKYGAQVLSRENLDLVLDEIPSRARDELAL